MKVTVWESANRLDVLLSAYLSDIQATTEWVKKWISIKHNTDSASILYIEWSWQTATTANGYPVAFWGAYHFEEAQLKDISLISSSGELDVRVMFSN